MERDRTPARPGETVDDLHGLAPRGSVGANQSKSDAVARLADLSRSTISGGIADAQDAELVHAHNPGDALRDRGAGDLAPRPGAFERIEERQPGVPGVPGRDRDGVAEGRAAESDAPPRRRPELHCRTHRANSDDVALCAQHLVAHPRHDHAAGEALDREPRVERRQRGLDTMIGDLNGCVVEAVETDRASGIRCGYVRRDDPHVAEGLSGDPHAAEARKRREAGRYAPVPIQQPEPAAFRRPGDHSEASRCPVGVANAPHIPTDRSVGLHPRHVRIEGGVLKRRPLGGSARDRNAPPLSVPVDVWGAAPRNSGGVTSIGPSMSQHGSIPGTGSRSSHSSLSGPSLGRSPGIAGGSSSGGNSGPASSSGGAMPPSGPTDESASGVPGPTTLGPASEEPARSRPWAR